MTESERSEAPAGEAFRRAPVSMFMSTVAGVGYLPGGPGTYAATLFVPALVWMSGMPLWARLGLALVATIASMWWADRAEKALEVHDSNRIVLDEVVGVWATLVWFSSLSWAGAIVGLVAFRVFDIVKPPGCRYVDDRDWGGAGVILDDIVAAGYAIPLVWAVEYVW